jgi:ABC-type nickel/cobalt efflux system permease component RcnA
VRGWRAGLLLGLTFALVPAAAEAHPLGNFTVNHYLGVVIRPDAVLLDYVVDMAEIPAFQARPQIEEDPARTCRDLASGIVVRVDEHRIVPVLTTDRLTFPPGQGGLETLRLECGYRADLAVRVSSRVLNVEDMNHADRIGWREIVARGEGASLSTTLPEESVSARLTAYPQSLVSTPLDVRSGAARVSVPAARDALPITIPAPDGAVGLAAALLLAIALGAFHALTPGHGKTVMAAYLVGTRGTRAQAFFLAVAVALSHTVGVLALAALTLAGSAVLAPERVYPYLSAISGTLILALGTLMVGARARHAHAHRHRHAHDHDRSSTALGWRALAALGLAGGIVPSASALVLLLGAISLHRAEFGLGLVVAFGIGMAAVLVGVGQALVGARSLAERGVADHPRLGAALRLAPSLSAAAVLLLGLGMTAQSLAALL